ncbi:MAG: FHA domain-containing protein [Oscillospiraceae bacterium]|nr:FHA domain-containing protein [Oscillospiraceae bacterium]
MKLAQESLLMELKCGTNVSYVLSDNNVFFMTGFKVLQGLEKSGFLRCVKASFNGQIQLIYLTKTDHSELKSFKSMLHSLDAEAFAAILKNVISGIVQAKTVGFLHCPNIETSVDHIYVDPKTYAVYLIYLPIMEYCAAEDISEFETELRAGMIQLIDSLPGFRVGTTLQLRAALTDGSKTLEDIVRGGGAAPEPDLGGTTPDPGSVTTSRMTLESIKHPTRFRCEIPNGTVILGNVGEYADIEIPGSPYIGRRHCKIIFLGGNYLVSDQDSKNHTYLNGKMLAPHHREVLHDGDELRLAGSTFRVHIS